MQRKLDAHSILQRRRFWVLATLIAIGTTVGAIALLINIFERKQEAKNPFF